MKKNKATIGREVKKHGNINVEWNSASDCKCYCGCGISILTNYFIGGTQLYW